MPKSPRRSGIHWKHDDDSTASIFSENSACMKSPARISNSPATDFAAHSHIFSEMSFKNHFADGNFGESAEVRKPVPQPISSTFAGESDGGANSAKASARDSATSRCTNAFSEYVSMRRSKPRAVADARAETAAIASPKSGGSNARPRRRAGSLPRRA